MAADRFLMSVSKGELDEAYARTTPAFRQAHSREAFAEQVRQYHPADIKAGRMALAAERTGPNRYCLPFHLERSGGRRTRFYVVLAGPGPDWKVDRWYFVNAPR